jgi:hypothetical protein
LNIFSTNREKKARTIICQENDALNFTDKKIRIITQQHRNCRMNAEISPWASFPRGAWLYS